MNFNQHELCKWDSVDEEWVDTHVAGVPRDLDELGALRNDVTKRQPGRAVRPAHTLGVLREESRDVTDGLGADVGAAVLRRHVGPEDHAEQGLLGGVEKVFEVPWPARAPRELWGWG